MATRLRTAMRGSIDRRKAVHNIRTYNTERQGFVYAMTRVSPTGMAWCGIDPIYAAHLFHTPEGRTQVAARLRKARESLTAKRAQMIALGDWN